MGSGCGAFNHLVESNGVFEAYSLFVEKSVISESFKNGRSNHSAEGCSKLREGGKKTSALRMKRRRRRGCRGIGRSPKRRRR